MRNNHRANIGKIYFFYLFFVLFLQIIGQSNKGGMLDTVWKAGVLLATLLYSLHKADYSINKYLLLPILIYCAGQVVACMYYPSSYISESWFTLVTNAATIVAMIYLFLSLPYCVPEVGLEDISYLLNGFILLVLYSIIYNFVTNPSSVINFMSVKNVYSNMMYSFFDNKQTFGMFIYLALMATVLQYVMKKKKIYIFATILLFLNLFICMSRTALLACIFFIAVLCLLLLNKKTGIPSKVLLATLVIAIIIMAVPALRTFLKTVVFDVEKTVDARENIWTSVFDLLKGKHLVFGYGDGNSMNVIQRGGYSSYSHNGIIQVLITGGIIKLVLYIISIVFTIRTIWRIRKYNNTLSSVFFAILSGVMIYSMGEAVVLFDTSAWCIASTIMCVGLPCIVDRYYTSHPDDLQKD